MPFPQLVVATPLWQRWCGRLPGLQLKGNVVSRNKASSKSFFQIKRLFNGENWVGQPRALTITQNWRTNHYSAVSTVSPCFVLTPIRDWKKALLCLGLYTKVGRATDVHAENNYRKLEIGFLESVPVHFNTQPYIKIETFIKTPPGCSEKSTVTEWLKFRLSDFTVLNAIKMHTYHSNF